MGSHTTASRVSFYLALYSSSLILVPVWRHAVGAQLLRTMDAPATPSWASHSPTESLGSRMSRVQEDCSAMLGREAAVP